MSFHKAFRWGLGVLLCLSVGTFLVTASTASASTSSSNSPASITSGGVNLNAYCKSLGDKGVALDGSTAYDWRCVTQDGRHVKISMIRACQWQFKDPNAADRLLDFYNPFSWSCLTHARLVGGIDMDGYCRSLGYDGFLVGTNAYTWTCNDKNDPGNNIRVNTLLACKWTNKNPSALDRLPDFYNPYSWQCWGSV
ncbi:MAG TPA: hypothetical protein VNE38_09110 [Ktedonobacteraceae bacterium]|nr:hypothetical protein [Ktedonobacteraceae bacterium]